MLSAWMGSAMLIGLMIMVAAGVLEVVFNRSAARRFVWLGAVVASSVLPWTLTSATQSPSSSVPSVPVGILPAASQQWSGTDSFALGVWALLSVVVLGILVLGHRAMLRQLRSVEPVDAFGHRVYVSDIGPAVVGFVRPRVVIPRWVSGLTRDDQRLVVTHEAEHVASGDQLLLVVALSAVVIFPWNPACWIGLHRLRRAIELDCDARVAGGADAARYGNVLLEARLHGPIAPVFNLAFARPAIAERIESLVNPLHPRRAEAAARCVAGAAILLALTVISVPPLPALGTSAVEAGGRYEFVRSARNAQATAGTARLAGGVSRATFTPRPDTLAEGRQPAAGGSARMSRAQRQDR